MFHQAYRIQRHGDEREMQLHTLACPEPGPGQVRVRHTAIGVNYIDTYHRSGLYPLTLPSGLGQEAVGVIEALGEGVEHWQPGDRVGYCSGPVGAYAETHVVPADRLLALPDNLTDTQAASVLLKGLTAAYLLLETYPVQAGQTLVWHAAAGGVGLIACQWAKALGARVIGTAGTPEKRALALAHGCEQAVAYTQLTEAVQVLTEGRGVPVVYDSVGKDTFSLSLDCLAPRGMLVSFGNASGPVPDFSPLLLAQKGSLYLTRPTLGHYTPTAQALQSLAERLFAAIAQGWIRVPEPRCFALSEAPEAHRALAGRHTQGACVLLP